MIIPPPKGPLPPLAGCPKCGKFVHTDAPFCPYCNHGWNEKYGTRFVIGCAAFFALIVIGIYVLSKL